MNGGIPQKGHDLKVFFHFNKPHYLALFSLRSFGEAVWAKVCQLGQALVEGVVNSLGAVFENGVKSLVQFFGSVLDFVAALKILPLVSFVAAIVDALIEGICYVMTTVANSAVTLYKPDIGTGGSLFELVLKGYSGIIPFLRILSIAFICIILVSSLAKIIINPQASETPMSVITGAIVAGVLSTCAPFLVIQAEKFFMIIYSGMLKMVPAEVDFELFATSANIFLVGGAASKFGALLEGLMTSVLLLILLLMIAWKFLGFVLEVAQRYLVLGTLLIFSPLACCFITTKSMRHSFKAYIRMIASTLFLMFMNVFFIALFLKSVGAFSDAITAIGAENSSVSKVAIVITWCIVEFGLLYVAGQFDSYLNTMGFSTAETGAGMMASMLMDAIDIGIINPVHSGKQKGGKLGALLGKVSHRRVRRSDGPQSPQKQHPIKMKSGQVDFANIADTMKNREGDDSPFKNKKTAAAAADSLLNALRNPKLKSQKFELDKLNITEGGVATLYTASDENGDNLSIALVPKQNLPDGFTSTYGGREISIPSQGKFVLLATGAKSLEYLTWSRAAEAAFKKRYGIGLGEGQVRHVRSDDGLTGVYRRTYINNTGIQMLTEWAPACSYIPDASLNAIRTRVGDMDYWTYDICVPQDSAGNIVPTCDNISIPSDVSSMQTWLTSQFTDIRLDGYKMVGGTAEQIHLEKEGEKFVMCPILSTAQVEAEAQLTRTYANNGAGYIMAKVNDFNQEAIDKVFTPRGSLGTPAFARKIDLYNSMQEVMQQSKAKPRFASNIAKTAYRKRKEDK